MKKYCKTIDITDRDFIERAVRKCLKTRMNRRDTIKLLAQYSHAPHRMIKQIAEKPYLHDFLEGSIQTMIDAIRQEILDKDYKMPPILYRKKIDGNSGKTRIIGIQGVKQQLYDYIACEGLWELFEAKIGYYQTEALTGKGQITALKTLKKWITNLEVRYAIQSDIRQFYPSIDQNILISMLEKDIANEPLLHLTSSLVGMSEKGLIIGSYLNKNLASYYLSTAYHYVTEQCYKERRGKRKRLLMHALWYADDSIFIGKDLRDLKKCQKQYENFLENVLHLHVKPDIQVIDLRKDYIDMAGFKVSRKSVTMRASNFRRLRRNIKRVQRYPPDQIPTHEARSIVSRMAPFAYTDMKHYSKQNNVIEICEDCCDIIGKNTRRTT